MFTKIFGKTLALATVTLGLLIAANGNIAEAGDRSKASESVGRHVHVHYRVVYMRYHHWHVYGTFSSYHRARHAAHHLRHHGYHVHIRRVYF